MENCPSRGRASEAHRLGRGPSKPSTYGHAANRPNPRLLTASPGKGGRGPDRRRPARATSPAVPGRARAAATFRLRECRSRRSKRRRRCLLPRGRVSPRGSQAAEPDRSGRDRRLALRRGRRGHGRGRSGLAAGAAGLAGSVALGPGERPFQRLLEPAGESASISRRRRRSGFRRGWRGSRRARQRPSGGRACPRPDPPPLRRPAPVSTGSKVTGSGLAGCCITGCGGIGSAVARSGAVGCA